MQTMKFLDIWKGYPIYTEPFNSVCCVASVLLIWKELEIKLPVTSSATWLCPTDEIYKWYSRGQALRKVDFWLYRTATVGSPYTQASQSTIFICFSTKKSEHIRVTSYVTRSGFWLCSIAFYRPSPASENLPIQLEVTSSHVQKTLWRS